MDQPDISLMAVHTQAEKAKKSDEKAEKPGKTKSARLEVEMDEGLNKDALLDMFGHVRDIRVEAQNLQRLLAEFKQKTQIVDASAREKELSKLLEEWKDVYLGNAEQVRFHFLEIKGILDKNSEIYDACGDEITRMDNSWERVVVSWRVLKDNAVAVPVEPDFAKVEEALCEIIFHAGYISIPNRVNQHLKKKWIGQELDFHKTFADELPSESERQEILKRLHENPMDLNGIVDPNSGLIFHISDKNYRRILSYDYMAIAFLVCGVLAAFLVKAGDWFGIKGYPFPGYPLKTLIINYLAIMIGGLAHLGFNALKQYRSSKESSFVALGNWFLWGHVKEKAIIGGIVLIWAVYVGCLFTMGNLNPVTVFFVGYSFDSFIDLFLKRFEIVAGKKVATIKSSL
jgi:hypothetical protein